MNLRDLKPELEISMDRIQWTVETIAKNVAEDIKKRALHKEEEFIMVVILKGGIFFAADLAHELFTRAAPPMKMIFVGVDSYRYEMEPGNSIHVTYPSGYFEDVTEKYVLIVDDISGTGRTLKTVVKDLHLIARVVRTAAMLYHPPHIPDYFGVGVHNPDLFAVGYGMDWKGKYRNDPTIRLYTKEQLTRLE